jgi:hypothetical protein
MRTLHSLPSALVLVSSTVSGCDTAGDIVGLSAAWRTDMYRSTLLPIFILCPKATSCFLHSPHEDWHCPMLCYSSVARINSILLVEHSKYVEEYETSFCSFSYEDALIIIWSLHHHPGTTTLAPTELALFRSDRFLDRFFGVSEVRQRWLRHDLARPSSDRTDDH